VAGEWGAADLCARRVNSRVGLSSGGVVVAEATPARIKVPQLNPHHDDALRGGVGGLAALFARGFGGFVSLGFLGVAGKARSTTTLVDFFLQLLPRRIGVLSIRGCGIREELHRRARQEGVLGAGWWFEDGGLDVFSRRRQRVAADPGVGERGEDPRPTCPSENGSAVGGILLRLCKPHRLWR
jgi:hypothetical protein